VSDWLTETTEHSQTVACGELYAMLDMHFGCRTAGDRSTSFLRELPGFDIAAGQLMLSSVAIH